MGITEQTPDHSTGSRTPRLIDLETHRAVFVWVLELLADRGPIQGKRVGIDATTLEANAAMRSTATKRKCGAMRVIKDKLRRFTRQRPKLRI
jgi:hypothetical protein